MCESPHADSLHTRLRNRPDGLQIHPSRGLQFDPGGQLVAQRDPLPQLRHAHVVEQHHVGLHRQHFRQLGQGVDLDFQRHTGGLLPTEAHHPSQRVAGVGGQPTGHVVVLHQQHVEQPHAMIPPPSRPDGVFVEQPPARERLAGVEDPGPGPLHLGDVAGGQRGDPREVQ